MAAANFYMIYIKRSADASYDELKAKMNLARNWYRITDSFWIAYTTSSAEKWYQRLRPFVDDSGSLLICRLDTAEEASVKEWTSGLPDVVSTLKELLEEAKALMAIGDATSAVTMDFARRFRAASEQLKGSEPSPLTALRPKLKAMVDDARSDPAASQKIEVLGFIEKTIANLKAKEDYSASEE